MGARAAMIRYSPVGVDEVQPLGGRPICFVDGVVHLLYDNGDGNVHVEATGLGNLFPLVVALVLSKQNSLSHVAVGLPAVGGVGFPDVHHQELNSVGVLIPDLLDALRLSAEGGSSVASEDQAHRPLTPEAGEPDALL